MSQCTSSLPPHAVLAISMMPIAALTPYANNARRHPDNQIKAIMRSLIEFGFTNPILIDEHGNVICGHGRLEAALRLGLAEVPGIVLSHLNEAQRRAYIIADNAIAEKSGWTKKTLALVCRAVTKPATGTPAFC